MIKAGRGGGQSLGAGGPREESGFGGGESAPEAAG